MFNIVLQYMGLKVVTQANKVKPDIIFNVYILFVRVKLIEEKYTYNKAVFAINKQNN